MKPQQTPCSISKVIGLNDHVVDFIKGPTPVENAPELIDNIRGGVLSDIRYSWLTNRARLEVLHTKTGQKVAAWSFRNMFPNISVSCVVDVPSQNGKAPYLVVGLEHWMSAKQECGTVCVFDVSSSRVLRAIHFDDRVTSVHVISVSSDASLPGALRALDGIIAVGTKNGKILLVDLCRQACDEAAAANMDDSECVRDEMTPCDLLEISMQNVKSLEQYKEMALQSGEHLCLQLNESCTDTDVVILKTPKGGHKIHVNKEEVTVSSLHYCPQLGSLLVGYNFGAFQLYNLLTVRLEYTSPVYEDCTPVTHFAVQEPCDDPRAFCYVWVMYSAEKAGVPGYPMAVMYALAYNTKEFLEGYGHLYQELVSCSVRFQTDLMAMPGSKLTNPIGARCVSLRAHTRNIVNKLCVSLSDVQEENLALCTVVWTVQDQNTTSETYLCLFDLNQWYKEQMPSSPRPDDSASYMVFVSLTELFRPATDYNGPLLDARIDTSSLNQFMCAQRLEEHYFPSALAFKCVCVREEDIVWFGSPGAQRHLLSCIELAGPLCLMRPTDIFHQCISLGLTPLYTDVPYNLNTPLNVQREMILSVCLEQQLVCWLCRCAVDWSNGSQASAGCTLDFLLKWAWQRANTLKYSANKLCVPLFDYSGMRLDANALIQLNHCTCQLKHLATLFSTVMNSCTAFLSKEDIGEIEHQLRMLRMITVYFEVLQWLLNVGLLPECHLSQYPRMDESERISAPYPAESLERFYQTRRAELRELQDRKKSTADSCDLLFIDNLIDLECGGSKLRKQWESDGGRGLYPPPSLQALLRTYLVEDIDIVHKHCLFIYVFLDLAMTLDQSRYKPIITHLIKFPAVFKLSPSIIKITQAFWQLDHGDFSTAMTQLLDTSVSSKDLKPWHHRTVLMSLLLQGQNQHALLYQQVRKPPITNIQDMCIVTTLLVVNDMLQEAFHFQRQNRTIYNERELLKHFFQVCDRTNQLSAVIQLPLCAVEETEFIKYLKANHQSENAKNLLVIYYLQRDRYGEAFDMNDRLNNNEISKQGLLGQRERNFRNVIVQGFKKTLPAVTQNLLDYCRNHKEKNSVSVTGRRPVPMSVLIHDSKQQATYKSTLIQTSLMKAKETWIQHTEQDNSASDNLNETPFISTPKVLPADKQTHATPVIYPAIVYPVDITQFITDLDDEPTPAKKMRLSPRQTMRSSTALNDEQTSQLDQFRRRLSCADTISLLDTPIVKRKTYRSTSRETDQFSIGTPTSILKVRSLLRNSISPDTHATLRGDSTTPEQLDDNGMDTDNDVLPLDTSTASMIKCVSMNLLAHTHQRKSSLGVSPRKPIQRTPRPAVRFEDTRYSPTEKMELEIPIIREKTPDRHSTSLNVDSKNSSRSAEETFYSPNTSFSDANTAQQQQVEQQEEQQIEMEEPLTPRRSALKRKATDGSVKSRRSYKSNVTITDSPVRALRSRGSLGASPRLDTTRTTRSTPRKSTSYLQEDTTEVEVINIPVQVEDNNETTNENNELHSSQINENNKLDSSQYAESTNVLTATKSRRTTLLEARKSTNQRETTSEQVQSPKKSEPFRKVAGRRSLARLVLEQNTLAKALSTPRTHYPTQLTPTGQTVEMSSSKSTTTIITKSSGNVTEECVSRNTSELKDTYSTERDPCSAAQVIKHVHNESSSKSNVHRVTEILDSMDTPDRDLMHSVNILSSDSDVSESFLSRYVTGSQAEHTRPRDSFLEEEFAAGMPVCESTVCEEVADSEPSAMDILMQPRTPANETELVDITPISEDTEASECYTMDVDVQETSHVATNVETRVANALTSVSKETSTLAVETNNVRPASPFISISKETSTLAVDTNSVRPASPFIRGRNSIREASPSTRETSPFTTAASPFTTATSSYTKPTSPFTTAASPFTKATSPFTKATSPFNNEPTPLPKETTEVNSETTNITTKTTTTVSPKPPVITDQEYDYPLEEEEPELEIDEEKISDQSAEDEELCVDELSSAQSSKRSDEEESQDFVPVEEEEFVVTFTNAEQDNDDESGDDSEVNVEIDDESESKSSNSSIEEKVSNQDDDENEEEQNLYEENVEELNVEDDSDQTSDHSSDVIEIKSSSSDESLEALELNQSAQDEQNINEELEQDIHEEDLEQNIHEEELEQDIHEEELIEEELVEEDEPMDTLEMNVIESEYEIIDVITVQNEANNIAAEDMTAEIISDKVTAEVTENITPEKNSTEQVAAIEQSVNQPSTDRNPTENSASKEKRSSEKVTENVARISTENTASSKERQSSEKVTENVPRISTENTASSKERQSSETVTENVPSKQTSPAKLPVSEELVVATDGTKNTSVSEHSIAVDCLESLDIPAPAVQEQLCRTDILSTDLSQLGTTTMVETADNEQMETESTDSKISDASTIPYIPVVEINAAKGASEQESTPPKPLRTSARRRSTLTEEPVTPARYSLRVKSVDKQLEIAGEKQRSRRASSVMSLQSTDEPTPTITTTRRTRRAASVDTTDSVKSLPTREVAVKLVRTRRGSSVDLEQPARTRRGSSADLEQPINKPETPAKRGRRRSSIQAEVIIEEHTTTESPREQIQEKIEEYSATHRLTRRQKAMMEKSMEVQQMKILNQKAEPRVSNMDPMKLMDKESFTGEPDTEERHLRQLSPASSIDTQSSLGTRSSARLRNKHHHSPGSDTAETPGTPKRKRGRSSAAPSVDSPTSEERPRRKSFTAAQQAITTPTRRSRRLTSQDTDVSETSSVMSVPLVAVVEIQRLPDERHRSLSPTMLKAEKDAAVSSKRKSIRTSIAPLRRELSKISEEASSNSDVADTKDLESMETIEEERKPRGKSRKSVLKESTQRPSTSTQDQQQPPPAAPGQRMSVYKPLEHYLPKYSAFKSRKSFKVVRRLTRRKSTTE